MMWNFLRGGATVIPGATFIPESRVCKGVSDLEMCMDYFAVPERSCEKILPKQLIHHHKWESNAVSPKVFWRWVDFSPQYFI